MGWWDLGGWCVEGAQIVRLVVGGLAHFMVLAEYSLFASGLADRVGQLVG